MNIDRFDELKEQIEQEIRSFLGRRDPKSLFEPITYSMGSGGKRIRPILTMLSCEAAGGKASDAIFAGIAVEIVHNFTLIHDDIMDRAAVRRNLPTVYKKWGENTAILAGDTMTALATKILLRTGNIPALGELVDEFATGIIEVCEGQALDLELGERADVSLDDYILMIDKKTAKMLELSAVVGGLIAGASPEVIQSLRKFANALGIAFQIQDDLLDAVAENAKFGKTIGGDILEGKKTYLILQAVRHLTEPNDKELMQEFLDNSGLQTVKVPMMIDIFRRTGVLKMASEEVSQRTERAHEMLNQLPETDARELLHKFADVLLAREH